jgi:hypothetical protein
LKGNQGLLDGDCNKIGSLENDGISDKSISGFLSYGYDIHFDQNMARYSGRLKNGLLDMQYFYGIAHEAIKFQGIRNPSLRIAEHPDVWHANQSPPTIMIVDWFKTRKTLDGQSLFTEVMVTIKGDIDLWYEEANHEEARA